MNALIKQLTESLSSKKRNCAEIYWRALETGDEHPDVFERAAIELGKDIMAIKSDAALVDELKGTQKPSDGVSAEIKKLRTQSTRASEKAAELILKGREEQAKSEQLRQQASSIQQQHEQVKQAYESVVRQLAKAGHPKFATDLEQTEAAREARRQAKLNERKREQLTQDVKRLKHNLEYELQKPLKDRMPSMVQQVESKLKTAQRELEALRSGV